MSKEIERLDELESKLAFLDDTVEQLSDVVARQDQELRSLKQRFVDLAAKLDDIGGSVPDDESGSQHEIPPHY